MLHYYLDLTHREMAEVLGIPAGTVASRMSRAMDGLRAALEADARTGAAAAASREAIR